MVRCECALMANRRNQEQVAWSEKAGPERDDSGDNLKNRELGLDVGLPPLLQKPSVDAEPVASHQGFRVAFVQCRLKVVKIDAPERFFNMELPRLAIQAEPVPIKHAVRRIAVLLNLEQHITGVDGVEPAARDENITVCLGRDPM